MRPFLALLAALSALEAWPVRAAQAPVLLGEPKRVEALCTSLTPAERMRFRGDAVERGKARAAHEAGRSVVFGRRYRVEIPGSRIAFEPYDEDEGELTLSPRAVLTAARGSLRIWASEDADLAVSVSQAEARRVLDAQREGALVLLLTFDLPDEDETGSPCAHAAGSRLYTLAVEPVSWEYASKGTVLARGGEGADRPRISAAQGARPAVEVGEPVSGSSGLRQAIAARMKELTACYDAALRRDPALDGTLAVEVALHEGGAPSVRIAADSLQDGSLADCVRETVAKASFPKGAGTATVPIHFALQAPAPVQRE